MNRITSPPLLSPKTEQIWEHLTPEEKQVLMRRASNYWAWCAWKVRPESRLFAERKIEQVVREANPGSGPSFLNFTTFLTCHPGED